MLRKTFSYSSNDNDAFVYIMNSKGRGEPQENHQLISGLYYIDTRLQ